MAFTEHASKKYVDERDALLATKNALAAEAEERERLANIVAQNRRDTYSKDEVNRIVEALRGARFVKVQALPELADADTRAIYLLPRATPEAGNSYDEWIVVVDGEGARSWDKLGSTDIDLSGYATKEEVQGVRSSVNSLASYVDALQDDIESDSSRISTLENKVDNPSQVPTEDSNDLISSGGVFAALAGKADKETDERFMRTKADIYLSARKGNDANDGLAPDRAVKSIARAYAAAKAAVDAQTLDGTKQVVVAVDEGVYGSVRLNCELTAGIAFRAVGARESTLVVPSDDPGDTGNQTPMSCDNGAYPRVFEMEGFTFTGFNGKHHTDISWDSHQRGIVYGMTLRRCLITGNRPICTKAFVCGTFIDCEITGNAPRITGNTGAYAVFGGYGAVYDNLAYMTRLFNCHVWDNDFSAFQYFSTKVEAANCLFENQFAVIRGQRISDSYGSRNNTMIAERYTNPNFSASSYGTTWSQFHNLGSSYFAVIASSDGCTTDPFYVGTNDYVCVQTANLTDDKVAADASCPSVRSDGSPDFGYRDSGFGRKKTAAKLATDVDAKRDKLDLAVYERRDSPGYWTKDDKRYDALPGQYPASDGTFTWSLEVSGIIKYNPTAGRLYRTAGGSATATVEANLDPRDPSTDFGAVDIEGITFTYHPAVMGETVDTGDKLAKASETPSVPLQTADIADGAVVNSKIGNEAVCGAKIRDKAVTRGKIADSAVDSTPTAGSNNLVTSAGVESALAGKLDKSGGVMTGELKIRDSVGFEWRFGASASSAPCIEVYQGGILFGRYYPSEGTGNLALKKSIGLVAHVDGESYRSGSLVVKDGGVYRCTASPASTESWVAVEWEKLFDLDTGAPASGDTKLITNGQAFTALQGKADKAEPSAEGNLAELDAQGNPTDSGKSLDDISQEIQDALQYAVVVDDKLVPTEGPGTSVINENGPNGDAVRYLAGHLPAWTCNATFQSAVERNRGASEQSYHYDPSLFPNRIVFWVEGKSGGEQGLFTRSVVFPKSGVYTLGIEYAAGYANYPNSMGQARFVVDAGTSGPQDIVGIDDPSIVQRAQVQFAANAGAGSITIKGKTGLSPNCCVAIASVKVTLVKEIGIEIGNIVDPDADAQTGQAADAKATWEALNALASRIAALETD